MFDRITQEPPAHDGLRAAQPREAVHPSVTSVSSVVSQRGETLPDPAWRPRLRQVTNSPRQELLSRPGGVDPLPDHIAALLASRHGLATVTRGGVTIKTTLYGVSRSLRFDAGEGGESLTILEHGGTLHRVHYSFNPEDPDKLHILDEHRRYVETLIAVVPVAPFDQEATAKAHAKKRREWGRLTQRLKDLHQPDTEAALAAQAHNNGVVERTLNQMAVFPAPAGNENLSPADKDVSTAQVEPGTGSAPGHRAVTPGPVSAPPSARDSVTSVSSVVEKRAGAFATALGMAARFDARLQTAERQAAESRKAAERALDRAPAARRAPASGGRKLNPFEFI